MYKKIFQFFLGIFEFVNSVVLNKKTSKIICAKYFGKFQLITHHQYWI